MKNQFLTIVLLFCTYIIKGQNVYIDILDGRTGYTFSQDIPVVFSINVSYKNIFTDFITYANGRERVHNNYPDKLNCILKSYTYDGPKKYKLDGDPETEYNYTWKASKQYTKIVTYEFRASGYEKTVTSYDYSCTGDYCRADTIRVTLIPVKQDVNLSGNVNLNQQEPKPESLGVLTTTEIAKQLGVPEDEILKLIQTQKLKAKKIGDKYFVRKEDFDAFMKQ